MSHPGIFIVEDESIVAGDLKETLISLGYPVAGVAKSGETAIEDIGRTHPDLVLMDIHLAGKMDGIDTAGKVHDRYSIPVIYLTAYADKELLERARQTQPYGYLIKPYDERALQSAIEMALYKHQMEKNLLENEETIRVMVNATSDLLYLIGPDGRFMVVNEALADLAGTTPDDLKGTSAYDLVAMHILSPRMVCWQLDPKGEKRLVFEEQLNHNWYDVSIYPVYKKNTIPEKYAVSVRNITHKKQFEEQTRNNAEYLRSMIEDASEIVIMLNKDGTFAQQSPSFHKALQYPSHENLKRSFFDHVSISEFQEAKQVFSEVLIHPGMAKPLHLKFERFDGTFCTIRGIISNQSDNPFVGRIVFNGWVE